MEPKDYIVSRIEGEYAYLKRTDIESEEESSWKQCGPSRALHEHSLPPPNTLKENDLTNGRFIAR